MIENQYYSAERSLYHLKDEEINNCIFESAIGESPLKEASNIRVTNSTFKIRYPFWHNTNTTVLDTLIDQESRAPFWYDKSINLINTVIKSVKVLRESNTILIDHCDINTDEFGWRCDKINMMASKLVSSYAFFESTDIDFIDMNFKGKYSFQYVKNVTIKDSYLDTKDAFWHCENVTVINSTIDGEYLGWYSKNLTLINCKIKGTQPLCYAENVKMINCEMADADLAFEYSTIDVDLNSELISIKNPLRGTIQALNIQEIIFDENRRSEKEDVQIIIKEV